MLKFLLFLLITIPLVELYVLIEVGSSIGGLATILLCLGTAALGATLVRYQGLKTIISAQESFMRGQAPTEQVLHGILLALTGILLVTPGFVTDILGFLLLIPALRNYLVVLFIAQQAQKIEQQRRFRQEYHDVIDIEIEPQRDPIKDRLQSYDR
ncbi:MAG: FxsA family protein [Zetaproteobacteria bacterium]|nr:FxsA family protein [Zetaproteobacteria bacterium]